MPEKKEGWKEEKREKKKGNIRIYGVFLLLPSQAMAE
jgi:hypothetical protein